jgi:hypothetical protein
MDLPDGTRRAETAREETERDAYQVELLLEAREVMFDTKKVELAAQKILAQHSTMMKMALSELVLQTIEDLRSPEVRPKDRALAMVALKTVGNQLYGWDREPNIQRMERAVTSYSEDDIPEDFPPTGAVNLRLIATSPEQLAHLAHLAEAKANRDGPEGASATGCNDQGRGPSAIAPEQPGFPVPQKEAPTGPVKEPIQPCWETDLQQAEEANRGNPPKTAPATPQNTLKHSVQQTSVQEPPPTPGSPAWHRLRIEELDRLRAERRLER